MGLVVWGAVTALLSVALLTFEATDFLQNREAASGPLGGNVFRAAAPLDLGKGELQAGQWVLFVFVLLSVVPVLVVQSRWVAEVLGRMVWGRRGWSLRLGLTRWVVRWNLSKGEPGRCYRLWMNAGLVYWSEKRSKDITDVKRPLIWNQTLISWTIMNFRRPHPL